jgi:hypothetical protein
MITGGESFLFGDPRRQKAALCRKAPLGVFAHPARRCLTSSHSRAHHMQYYTHECACACMYMKRREEQKTTSALHYLCAAAQLLICTASSLSSPIQLCAHETLQCSASAHTHAILSLAYFICIRSTSCPLTRKSAEWPPTAHRSIRNKLWLEESSLCVFL